MTTTWKQAQKEYRQKLSERYGVSLRESLDIDAFKRNPRKYFDENGWVIPKEDFEDVAVALAELANSDSEISVEDVELGKKGEYVQGIVQKLMTTDKMFAKVMDRVNSHMTEGKVGRRVAIALTCLALLVGAGAIADAYDNNKISYSPSVSSSTDYSAYKKDFSITDEGLVSGWKSFNFVDDFGDETGNTGIKLSAYDMSNKRTHTLIIERSNQNYLLTIKLDGLYMYGNNDTDISIKIKTLDGKIKEYPGRYLGSIKRVCFKYTADNNEAIELMKDTCHIIIKVYDTKFDLGSIGISSYDLGKVHSAYTAEKKTSEVKKEEVKKNEVKNEIKEDDRDTDKEEVKEETTTTTKSSGLRKLPAQAKRELNDAYTKMVAGKMLLNDFYTLVHRTCAEYLGQTFPKEEINRYFNIE